MQDPVVVEILSWFDMTHELVMTGFAAYWRLAWLPGPGSVGEQDAWLLDGLTAARAAHQAALLADMHEQRGHQGLRSWRDRIRRERG